MRSLQQLLVVLCLIFLVPAPACAQTQHVSHDQLLAELQQYQKAYSFFMQNRLVEAAAQLQEELKGHEEDAHYFYLLGILQLKAKLYADAANTLERVVLIDPNNAGAWLDLAIANVEIGNFPVAKSFFNYLEATFAPPTSVQQVIARYRQRMDLPSTKPQPQWQTTVEFMAGHDTNANNKLQASSISITYLGDRYDLLIDESLRAKADNFAQLTASTRYRKQWDRDGLELLMAARNKSFTDHHYSSSGVTTAVQWQHASRYSLNGLAANFDYDSLGGVSLLRNFRLTGTLERAWNQCRIGIGAEAEWRRYFSIQAQDANVSWGQIAAACELLSSVKPVQLAFISRIGIDKPTTNRAGGKTQRKESVLQLSSRLLPRLQLDFAWNFSDAYDQFGYSALLENNARRRILRHTYHVQLITPLQSDVDLFFRIDQNNINSNLNFFTQSGKSFSLGLQRRF